MGKLQSGNDSGDVLVGGFAIKARCFDRFLLLDHLREHEKTAEMRLSKMLKSAKFQARLNNRIDVERLSRLKDDPSYTLAEAVLVWMAYGRFNAIISTMLDYMKDDENEWEKRD